MNQHEEHENPQQSEGAENNSETGSNRDVESHLDEGEVAQSAGPESSADSEPADLSLADQLGAAQEEIAKLKDAYLRAKAEEDNVRRRSEKEVANSRKFAVEGFAKEMLQVRDSLKMACSVEIDDNADDAVKSVHEGVEITLKQLDAGLAKFSVTEVLPEVGDKLDPNLHQAMSIVESEDVDSGCVLNVIQSGYLLHDRLLRPAVVVVAK